MVWFILAQVLTILILFIRIGQMSVCVLFHRIGHAPDPSGWHHCKSGWVLGDATSQTDDLEIQAPSYV
jgi:hypothetical protein